MNKVIYRVHGDVIAQDRGDKCPTDWTAGMSKEHTATYHIGFHTIHAHTKGVWRHEFM